jgi:hypothetical protein
MGLADCGGVGGDFVNADYVGEGDITIKQALPRSVSEFGCWRRAFSGFFDPFGVEVRLGRGPAALPPANGCNASGVGRAVARKIKFGAVGWERSRLMAATPPA